jgi:PAS domain S-box-containing protein
MEDRYRILVEAITDYAIYMIDTQGVVSSWNAGARRFKGYEHGEIIGQNFERFYLPEDRAAGLPAKALHIAATQGRFEGEGWRLRKDGSRFWVHVVIDPIHAPSGELIGYAKITRDLTERRDAEEKRLTDAARLRTSEEQFRMLVQSVTDYAIYMLDPDGRVANWNKGAERIKGYTPDEIVGRHFSEFYGEEDRKNGEPRKGLEIARREGRFEKEGWRYRKDGSRFWASIVIDPVHTPEGAFVGYAKITRDITERREAALALERAREAIVQSQKMEAIGQLTGGVAHDFNNLLMAVLGSLELLRKRMPDEPKLKLLLNNAFEAARRGVALTQCMLSFAHRQEMSLVSVDVRTLVGGMADLLERTLGPLLVLETEIPRGLPNVKADANQLETGLLNLAANARDATPYGGAITISARFAEIEPAADTAIAPGPYVCIAVTDSGEGMDAATLARAMEPFFTTKGVGKGTGLGLSMVHGMAEQMAGKLVLRSEKGKGTIAEIYLPVSAKDLAAQVDNVQSAAAGQETRCMTILVVDDDKLVLVNTTAMLEELGHTVLAAASGQQALAVIRDTPHIDMLITDQAMPNMTGVELAAIIKMERPELPMMLVSGYAELLVSDFQIPKLAKPFTMDDLEAAIASFAAGTQDQEGAITSSYRN